MVADGAKYDLSDPVQGEQFVRLWEARKLVRKHYGDLMADRPDADVLELAQIIREQEQVRC